MPKPLSTKTIYLPFLLIILLAGALLTLNILRIINIPLTHDEAGTYLDFATSTYRNIWIFNPVTANNHILNSLLTKFLIENFNSTPFFLRLPNLIAQVLYLAFGFMLLKKVLKNEWWVLTGMVLLNLNPFLFDFWGLSRGYGLSLGLVMSAIYFCIQYCYTSKKKYVLISLVIAALATLANFSALNIYAAIIGLILLHTIIASGSDWKKELRQVLAFVILCSVTLYMLIVQPLIELHESGELYFGGNIGFISDTVKSLVAQSILLEQDNAKVTVIAYTTVAITLLMALQVINDLVSQRGKKSLTGLYFLQLLLLPVLSTIVQHVLFKILYLIERTALLFYPVFILFFIVVLKRLERTLKAKICLVLALLATVYNFGSHLNISYAANWKYDMHNKLVLDRITRNAKQPVKIKLYWMFIPSFRYYTESPGQYGDRVGYIERWFEHNNPDTAYDYYYIHKDDLQKIPDIYTEDTSFFNGKYILLKKR